MIKYGTTVIIPAYNVEAFIGQTIQSLLVQSYTKFQVIVVDDGSTDATSRIISQFVDRDSRIKLISKTNGGVSSARNMALDLVATKYFTFIDGDDVVSPDYLKVLVESADKSRVDIVTTNVKAINGLFRVNGSESTLSGIAAAEKLLYSKGIQNSPCAKIYRTETLGKIRFSEQLKIGEDMEYIFRCLIKSNFVMLTNYEIYNYVKREGSAMMTGSVTKCMDGLSAALQVYEQAKLVSLSIQASTKVFSEALPVIVSVSNGARESKSFKQTQKVILSVASDVMRDKNTRLRYRVYAAWATFNLSSLVCIFRIKNRLSFAYKNAKLWN